MLGVSEVLIFIVLKINLNMNVPAKQLRFWHRSPVL